MRGGAGTMRLAEAATARHGCHVRPNGHRASARKLAIVIRRGGALYGAMPGGEDAAVLESLCRRRHGVLRLHHQPPAATAGSWLLAQHARGRGGLLSSSAAAGCLHPTLTTRSLTTRSLARSSKDASRERASDRSLARPQAETAASSSASDCWLQCDAHAAPSCFGPSDRRVPRTCLPCA